MSFQVLAVEEGGRRVIEKSWEDIEEEMIVSSRREQTKRWAEHILRGMKEGEQGERSNGSERDKSREGEQEKNSVWVGETNN